MSEETKEPKDLQSDKQEEPDESAQETSENSESQTPDEPPETVSVDQSDSSDSTQETIENPEEHKRSDTFFIYAIGFIILTFLFVMFIPRLFPSTEPTLDELFKLNLEGKLSPDKGYMYKGAYNFVYYDGLWYTQLTSPSRTKVYNMPFHFSPRDVEQIQPLGRLNRTALNKNPEYYMTFNPTDEELRYIAVAIGETSSILINAFGKGITTACAKKMKPQHVQYDQLLNATQQLVQSFITFQKMKLNSSI